MFMLLFNGVIFRFREAKFAFVLRISSLCFKSALIGLICLFIGFDKIEMLLSSWKTFLDLVI